MGLEQQGRCKCPVCGSELIPIREFRVCDACRSSFGPVADGDPLTRVDRKSEHDELRIASAQNFAAAG